MNDSAATSSKSAPSRPELMKVHINLANASVVLVVLFLSGVLVRLGSSGLLGRSSHDNTAAFVFLVGPNTEKDNRTRGLGTALHTLYHHYQVRPLPPPLKLAVVCVTLTSCGVAFACGPRMRSRCSLSP